MVGRSVNGQSGHWLVCHTLFDVTKIGCPLAIHFQCLKSLQAVLKGIDPPDGQPDFVALLTIQSIIR